jgi:hypothetical protein
MSAGETAAHRRLKELARDWAVESGLAITALEVRVPRSGYRVDVAAYARGTKQHPPRTALFECKQARADLLKDARAETATRERLAGLLARRAGLEALIVEHRPDLRRGETLFPEFDSFDPAGLRHETYAAVIDEIAMLQRRLLLGVKFEKLRRYLAADALYLVVEDGIFAVDEIPAGWGLLVRQGDVLRAERPPLRLNPTPETRLALLENMAATAGRAGRPAVS